MSPAWSPFLLRVTAPQKTGVLPTYMLTIFQQELVIWCHIAISVAGLSKNLILGLSFEKPTSLQM